jgi:Mu transposase-like protein
VAVQVATRWIIARVRNRRLVSLSELNAAIAELVTVLNNWVARPLDASRRMLFEELEQPALNSLAIEPYTYAQWKECKPGLDYHVEVEKHYYSVPYQLMREKMWVRMTARTWTRPLPSQPPHSAVAPSHALQNPSATPHPNCVSFSFKIRVLRHPIWSTVSVRSRTNKLLVS